MTRSTDYGFGLHPGIVRDEALEIHLRTQIQIRTKGSHSNH